MAPIIDFSDYQPSQTDDGDQGAETANDTAASAGYDEQQDDGSRSMTRALMRRAQVLGKEIKKAEEQQKHWQDEARAHEQKKNVCMVLLIVAIGNDAATIFADLVSFGLLGSLTAPVPGLLRFIVSGYEREQKPDRLLRMFLVMGLKAIPAINVLPSTTFLMVVDLTEASTDLEMAKNKEEAEGKKIKKLKNEQRQLSNQMRARTSRAA